MGDGEDKRKRRAATIPSSLLYISARCRVEGEHPTGACVDVGGEGEWDRLFVGWPVVSYGTSHPLLLLLVFFADHSFVDGVHSWFTLAGTTIVSRSHPSAEHITAATDVHTPYAGAIVVGMCPRLTGQAPSQTPELSFS